jgi:hypothetical protein
MSDYIGCPGCDKQIKRLTSKPERYRKHKPFKGATADNRDCDYGGTVIPEEELCRNAPASTATSSTASSVTSPDGGERDAPESAPPATTSTPSSPISPDEGESASAAPASGASTPIPGVERYAEELNGAAAEQLDRYRAKVEANLSPFTQPTPHDFERPTLFSQPVAEGGATVLPPALDNEAARSFAGLPPSGPAFSQAAGRRSEQPEVEMSTDAASIAARLKELFYSYDNRRASDNRSAQVTMGPSEMGTPCDRRLALSIMRMPPVNPGGDGWAAFVGTAIHAALEQMFVWADAGTGRFAVEQRLEFGHPIVPKGTADLFDRTLLMILDHKCQGRWSRNKLKTQGPSPTYKVQAHVYAYGARLRGEKIEKIAIVSWPRDEATLDDLYVHVEDYNPAIAMKAFERVDNTNALVLDEIDSKKGIYPDAEELEIKARVAADFTVADDCRFCPFYLPNARDITRGCNGKR